ncbi:MAG: MFS transporter [Rhizobiaceae bacterium]|nr:MFS transporter [Rhizobiaceae bacterium]
MTNANMQNDPAPSGNLTPRLGNSRWIALGGLWLVYAAFGAMVASIAPLLPEIRTELQTDNTTLGAIMGAWPLVYIAAAIPAGILLDTIGTRTGLFFATLIIALSGLLRACADTPGAMLLAVAVFGIGGPLISTGAPKLIAALFSGPNRGTAMGIYVTGPAMGSILTLSTTNAYLLPLAGTWRGVMLIHSGMALLSGLLWLACAGPVVSGPIATVAQRFDRRAVGLILLNPQVVAVLTMAVGIFYINHGLANWLPSILRAKGMAAAEAGAWASIPTLFGLAAALIVPRFAGPSSRLPLLAVLFSMAGVAGMAIAFGSGFSLAAGLALQGIARGTMMTIAILVLVELPAIPENRIGLASGIFFSAAEIGGVLGPISFGLLRDATGAFLMPALSITIVAALLLLLVVRLMLRSRQTAVAETKK